MTYSVNQITSKSSVTVGHTRTPHTPKSVQATPNFITSTPYTFKSKHNSGVNVSPVVVTDKSASDTDYHGLLHITESEDDSGDRYNNLYDFIY